MIWFSKFPLCRFKFGFHRSHRLVYYGIVTFSFMINFVFLSPHFLIEASFVIFLGRGWISTCHLIINYVIEAWLWMSLRLPWRFFWLQKFNQSPHLFASTLCLMLFSPMTRSFWVVLNIYTKIITNKLFRKSNNQFNCLKNKANKKSKHKYPYFL